MTYKDIQSMPYNKFDILSEIMRIEEQYESREIKKHSQNNKWQKKF